MSSNKNAITLSRKIFPFIKSCGIHLTIERKLIRATQRCFIFGARETENIGKLDGTRSQI